MDKYTQDKLRNYATYLSNEIANRGTYNVSETETLIFITMQEAYADMIKSIALYETEEYSKLLKIQQTLKLGSRAYIEHSYKLSIAKDKKKQANKALNDLHNNSKYNQLRDFVIKRFGQEAMDEFKIKDLSEVYISKFES